MSLFKSVDFTAEKMASQEKRQQDNYKNIIKDLGQIHEKAQDALKKLGNLLYIYKCKINFRKRTKAL